MKSASRRLLYFLLSDGTWWAWTVTTALLVAGLAGYDLAFIGAMGVTAGQGFILLVRYGNPTSFAVQLRAAYLFLLFVAYPPSMRWLYWVPAVGTFALVVFGYCLLARILSLMPWNRRGICSLAGLRRTFLSRPDLGRVASHGTGCGGGGLCTIEAQLARRRRGDHRRSASQVQ